MNASHGRGLRAVDRCDQGDGIADRLVAAGREPVHDRHVRARPGIRRIDDPGGNLAARDQREGCAGVGCRCEAILHLRPHPERLERLPGVAADRHVIGIADRESPFAQTLGKGRTLRETQREPLAPGGDEYQRIGEQVPARTGDQDIALLQVVHPSHVGSKKDVGRRAVLDLPGQGRTGSEDGLDVVAALLLESLGHGLDGVGGAARGENRDGVRPGSRRHAEGENRACETTDENAKAANRKSHRSTMRRYVVRGVTGRPGRREMVIYSEI